MKIKKEERPTVIALGVAIGAVLVFGASRFLGSSNAAATPSSTLGSAVGVPASPSALVGTAPLAGMSTGSPNPAAGMAMARTPGSKSMYDDVVPEPATTHDPFTPAVKSAELPDTAFSGRPLIPSRVTTPRVVTTTYPPALKITPFNNKNPFAQTTPPPANGLVTTADANSPATQMVLAGVIAGPQAVAVIHIGDRAYPLTSGEKMPYNMSLTRITEDGVYVKQGKQTWFIEVGKSLSAAMPIKTGMQNFKTPGSMASDTNSGMVRRVAAAENGQAVNTVELVAPTTKTSEETTVINKQP